MLDRAEIKKKKIERCTKRRRARAYEKEALQISQKMQIDHFIEFHEWLPLDQF